MDRSLFALIVFSGTLVSSFVSAHEFWIEPESAAAAQVRVGQMLVGKNLPYLDRTIRSARHFGPNGETALKGRQGDVPALSVDLSATGLHRLTIETEPAYIVFETLHEFSDYLTYEGLHSVVSQHQARGLPTTEIAEEYLRYAKSLVQMGNATDETDEPVGLRYEIVAITSPFASQAGMVELQLLWEGHAEPGAQIAVFHKGHSDDAAATRQLLQSDDQGKVTTSVAAPGTYVFNAVHMLPADGPGSVVWQSHWASLSFTLGSEEPTR